MPEFVQKEVDISGIFPELRTAGGAPGFAKCVAPHGGHGDDAPSGRSYEFVYALSRDVQSPLMTAAAPLSESLDDLSARNELP
jgi:hypothetical protein